MKKRQIGVKSDLLWGQCSEIALSRSQNARPSAGCVHGTRYSASELLNDEPSTR